MKETTLFPEINIRKLKIRGVFSSIFFSINTPMFVMYHHMYIIAKLFYIRTILNLTSASVNLFFLRLDRI